MADAKKESNRPETPEELYEKAAKLQSIDGLIQQESFRADNFLRASELFQKAGDYKDAKVRAEECRLLASEANEAYRENQYAKAVARMNSTGKPADLEAAQKMFAQIPDYLDSAELAEECGRTASEKEDRAAKRRQTIVFSAGLLVIAAVIFINTPAWKRIRAGIRGEEIPTEEELFDEALRDREPGSEIEFGPFSWYILDRDDDSAKLMLAHAEKEEDLRGRPYNEVLEDTSWAECSLREWLNGDFLTENFSPEEQARILSLETEVPANPRFGTQESSTEDKVRIPYPQEVEDYSEVFGKIKMNIWLLSPGSEADAAMFMSPRHTLMEYGYAVDCTDFYVCPVVRLSLDAE